MREAIANAVVGDEQEREDPTVLELERRVAAFLGQEEAVFVPTATMANQIALRILTRPGDELLAEENSHVFLYEQGGPAVFSGLVMRGLPGHHGKIAPEQIRAAMRDWSSGHMPITRLVSIENTHNSSGGRVWTLAEIDAVAATVRELDLRLHLDGARIVNAATALGVPPAEIGRRVRHGHALPVEGSRLPARRARRRLRGADGRGAAGEAPVRRRDAAGGDRRGRRRLRARPPRRPDRRRPRACAAARRGVGRRPVCPSTSEQVETNFVFLDVGPLGMTTAEASARLADAGVRALRHGASDDPPRRHAPRHLRRGRRPRVRARPAGARSRACPLPESLADELELLVRREQHDKRLPSVAAAVVRDGETVWATAVGAADTAAGSRRDAGHAVPHRLDHEDVHRGRGDAAPRRRRARPRGHARPAHRGSGAQADAAAAPLAHVGAPARDARTTRGCRSASPPRRSWSRRSATRSRCCRPARASTTRTSRSRCSGSSSSARPGCRTRTTCGAAARAARAEPDRLRPGAAGGDRVPRRGVRRGSGRRGGRRDRRLDLGRPDVGDGGRPLPLGRVPRRSRRVGARPRVGRGDADGADDRRPRALDAAATGSGSASAATASGSSPGTAAPCRASSPACSSRRRTRSARPC